MQSLRNPGWVGTLNKSPVKQGLSKLLWSAKLHECCHTSLLEELVNPQVTPLGRNTCKFMPGFSWTLPHGPFLFDDFNLYLFTIINYNHSITAFLRVVSPYSKSLSLLVALEILDPIVFSSDDIGISRCIWNQNPNPNPYLTP